MNADERRWIWRRKGGGRTGTGNGSALALNTGTDPSLYSRPMAESSPTAAPATDLFEAAAKLGDLIAAHPAVARYKDAQKSVSADPEAGRLLGEYEKEMMALVRQEQQGMPISDAQQQKLVALQGRISSNIRIKALNLAEMDFYDMLRKVNQTMLRQVGGVSAAGAPGQGAPQGGARLSM
jgi:cell fate (sporulation/competence/biofilm development) regulator YlbF (YheA/YmcA/DUF963 family)